MDNNSLSPEALQEALQIHQSILQTLTGSVSDLVCAKNTKSQFIFCNQKIAEALGAKLPEEMLGKTDFDYYLPEIAEEGMKEDRRVFQGEEIIDEEKERIVEGKRIVLYTTKIPLRDKEGRIIGLVAIARDVTEWKRVLVEKNQAERKVSPRFSVLRQVRKNAGMTIEDLAKKANLSFSIISMLERNKGNPSLDTLQNLAESLNMTTAELVALADPMPALLKKSRPIEKNGFLFHRTEMEKIYMTHGLGKKEAIHTEPPKEASRVMILGLLQGALQINYGSNSHILEPNETIRFNSYLEHKIIALEDCEFYLIDLPR